LIWLQYSSVLVPSRNRERCRATKRLCACRNVALTNRKINLRQI
jgi:hypothetical protein